MRWLLRMALWARRPPSEKRVKLVLGVIVACVSLVILERLLGWPDWLTVNKVAPGRF